MEPQPPHTWWVVVPVKGGSEAKSRLRLTHDHTALASAIAQDTVERVVASVGASTIVVTGDPREAASATSIGASVVEDPGRGLNAAAERGVAHAIDAGASQVAVLLGDHPCLTTDELSAALTACGRHTTSFVPDAVGSGTALVATTTGTTVALAFGEHSAQAHANLGYVRLNLDLPGLRHDVDDEASLTYAASHLALGQRTRSALGKVGGG